MPLTLVHVGGSHLLVTPKYTKTENPRVGVGGAGLTQLHVWLSQRRGHGSQVLTRRFSSYQRRLEGCDSVPSDDLGYRSSEVLRFHPTNSTSSWIKIFRLNPQTHFYLQQIIHCLLHMPLLSRNVNYYMRLFKHLDSYFFFFFF